jgi:DNA repair exonuclease SbcCD ATPase subunit
MQLVEIIFQGAFGCFDPVRLTTQGPVSSWALPAGVQPRDIQTVLIALCYPRWLGKADRERLGANPTMKLAATFEVQDRQVRVLRRDSSESLRLQVQEAGGWKEVARGLGVEKTLQEKLGMPSFAVCAVLHFWRFDEPLPPEKPPVELDALEPKLRDIVQKYRTALVAERLDDEIKFAEGRVAELRKSLGEGAKLEEKYEKARARLEELQVKELSEEDRQVLRQRDERLSALAQQIHRLAAEEAQASEQLDMLLPDRFWKNPVFLGGLVLGLAALVVSVVMRDTMRLVALADVVGFGASAWVMLRYYNDMEQAAIQGVRLDSIKRRLNQVREEQVSFQDRVHHILVHAGVQNEAELLERVEKSQQLAEIIGKMEAQLAKLRSNPDYLKNSQERDELEARLVELYARREQTPSSALSAYQLESDMRTLGLEPVDFTGDLDGGAGLAVEREEDRDALMRLMAIARKLGQAQVSGEMSPKTQKMWSKICAHVLGPRFEEVSLVQGQLAIKGLTDAQREMWLKTRGSEVQIVAAALAVALQVNEPERAEALRTVVVADPDEIMSPEHATRFKEVFASAARRSQVVLLRKGKS